MKGLLSKQSTLFPLGVKESPPPLHLILQSDLLNSCTSVAVFQVAKLQLPPKDGKLSQGHLILVSLNGHWTSVGGGCGRVEGPPAARHARHSPAPHSSLTTGPGSPTVLSGQGLKYPGLAGAEIQAQLLCTVACPGVSGAC